MRTWSVYRHPIKGYEAVKDGFSWPGFFFTWIWAFVKGLVGMGFLLLGAVVVMNILSAAGEETRNPGLSVLSVVLGLAAVLVTGFNGNKWREKALARKGYEFLEKVQADSPEAATSKYSGPGEIQAKVDAAVKAALERKAAESKSEEGKKAA
jgi:Protein of unknown function (DUF2628)